MAFSFERSKTFTGKVQYRIDGMSVAIAIGKTWKRAEVKAIKNPAYANGIVASGNFAHVPSDTPVGVPGDGEESTAEVATNEPAAETTETTFTMEEE